MKKRKRKTKSQKWWGFLKFQMVLIVLVIAAVAYYYAGGYAAKIKEMKTEAVNLVAGATRDTFRQDQTSIAYDCKGETLSVLKGEKDAYYVEYDDIPIYIKQAIVSTEDKRFFKHKGLDYKGILRAIVAMIRDGEVTQGGSTITQQLARTVFLSNEKTWERKIEEMYIAVELEAKYSKEDILEFYINNVYFANGYYGIQAAAEGYFGVDVNHLSLSQMVYLCAIPNNPTMYNPLKKHDMTIKRRNRILKTMLDDGVISDASYKSAKKEVIEPKDTAEPIKNDYAQTYTYYCATRALMESQGFQFKTTFKDDTEKKKYQDEYDELYSECNKKLFTGGYRIYTSIDLTAQNALQDTLNQQLAGFTETNEENIYSLQGAAVCIDNTTGMVRAIVGGRSQDLDGYTLNRAYQSFRQPGSAIKPLIVYTPALEKGYTADTVVVDEPIEGGPVNGDGVYSGAMSLRQAVAVSKNTVAWKIFDELTPEYGISFLEAMDFSKLDKNDKRLPASIGGFTNGVSPLEMAKGYATIANNGGYRNPTCIEKITNAQGEEIYKADQTATVIYKENACRQMTDILQSVITSGTGRGYSLGSMPCAGKTGTTNDNKDGWFVGYTPYYTTSVWVGYDIPKEVPGLGGGTYPGRIWHDFMVKIHEGLDPVNFVSPVSGETP
ncbi:MAG: PBP1A family penicillin-binding protein [Lachnospiraceae bacterium]|nr:PBP1A family penicillin-binding protein [Lachnospiraceae bacterium]MDY4793436.1 PBP1A family penicillin-binding protein [Pararoseburia sp.]